MSRACRVQQRSAWAVRQPGGGPRGKFASVATRARQVGQQREHPLPPSFTTDPARESNPSFEDDDRHKSGTYHRYVCRCAVGALCAVLCRFVPLLCRFGVSPPRITARRIEARRSPVSSGLPCAGPHSCLSSHQRKTAARSDRWSPIVALRIILARQEGKGGFRRIVHARRDPLGRVKPSSAAMSWCETATVPSACRRC